MVAVEVSVNGTRICTAAADRVLSVIVSWTPNANAFNFHVGGIRSQDNGDHCDWDVPEIGIGDEVTIRLVDVESPEPAPKIREFTTTTDIDIT